MCSNNNAAIVDSLECYMDEVVDSFQDFVRKSLLIITVAVGSLIGLLLYILKLVKQRNANFAFGDMSAMTQAMNTHNTGMVNQTRNITVASATDEKIDGIVAKSETLIDTQNTPRRRCCNLSCGKATSISTQNTAALEETSNKEMEFKNVGLNSCLTECIGISGSDRPSSRTTVPSLPVCDPSCAVSKGLTSCCSMCCGEQK